jgi:dsDNA-binding SOS-regulon protein
MQLHTPKQTTGSEEMLEIAEKLAKLIDKSIEDITLRDQQDFWIIKNKDKAYKKVSKKEEAKIQETTNSPKIFKNNIDILVREKNYSPKS